MQKTIISDTSCLVILEKIKELELLHRLFGTIITTSEIKDEFGLPLPEWVLIKQVKNKNYQSIIEATLDKGEASAIALALELEDCLLIIDDLKGRKFANQLGLKITETFGVLVEAKLSGAIPSIKPILEKIKATNFRIGEQLEALILKKAGEQ
jgi:predicted nucleic acid-binding protein